MNNRVLLIFVLTLLLQKSNSFCGELFVPDDHWTIQSAIDAAANGDTITIKDGTYSGGGNVNLESKDKQLTIRSLNGPINCIINGGGTSKGFYLEFEYEPIVIEGLTIMNCASHGIFARVVPKLILIDCIFKENISNSDGAGVYAQGVPVDLINCVFIDNIAADDGGAIDTDFISSGYGEDLFIMNCTFIRNLAKYGGAVNINSSENDYIINSIFWGNVSSHSTNEHILIEQKNLSYPATIVYNNVEGGYGGTGNINSNPSFKSSEDYHLAVDSPCIDAGTNLGSPPTYDIDGNFRPVGGAYDMGADECSYNYYRDIDEDNFGDPIDVIVACTQPSGYVSNSLDCDDEDTDEYPGQSWYKDADFDGYSDGTSNVACERPDGYRLISELSVTSGDCNDSDQFINPGFTEVCDGIDNDCDNEIDEGVKTTYYADVDDDGYGDPIVTEDACSPPIGYVENANDLWPDDPNEWGDNDGDGIGNNADTDDDNDGVLDEDDAFPYDPDLWEKSNAMPHIPLLLLDD